MTSEQDKDPFSQLQSGNADLRNELMSESAKLYVLVRRILLTALGTIALSADEANEFISRLVERGELAESEIHKLFNETSLRTGRSDLDVSSPIYGEIDEARSRVESGVESLLLRLNVPTMADIDRLSGRIAALNEKMNGLSPKQ